MTAPPRRLVDRFPVGAEVEVLLRDGADGTWAAGRVVGHAHPGVWVEAARARWFVTNGSRIRERPAVVYKIATREEWDAALRAGAYEGSPDDLRDGFVHLSAAHQLRRTAEKHFAGRDGLLLLDVSVAALATLRPGALRWERSRGGDLFPHLYAAMPCDAVARVRALAQDDQGVPLIPPDVPA